jgi:predicted metal-dependent TIM-barrel fold hydrolase
MTNLNSSTSFGAFTCEAGEIKELLANTALACPCCNGQLTADQLARLIEDVRRLEQGRVERERETRPGEATGAPATAGLIIDPHTHMISRTTDDYEAMAKAGIVAVIEPAFWLGQPRTTLGSFLDYFAMISGFERFRAGQFGIRHYCTIGLNPKEANNEALAEAVLAALPRFLVREGVVAMGELGYDEQTPLEDKALRAQIELAKQFDLPIMIHTPHRDKRAGTLRTMDVLKEHGFDPTRCVIDHNNEETVREVKERGYWVAFSIYPNTKMGSERMAAIVKSFGPERLIVDSACDWGVSDPLAVAKTARLMLQSGIAPEAVGQVTYANALAVYGLNGEMRQEHWLAPAPIDQRTLYEGNSVLRGGQTPRIERPGRPADELRIN